MRTVSCFFFCLLEEVTLSSLEMLISDNRATSKAMPQFMGGRFLLGFGVSYCCIAAPTYVSELAHPKVRFSIVPKERFKLATYFLSYQTLLIYGSWLINLQWRGTLTGLYNCMW